MSFDIILPFLRPLEHLILDDTISEIMVNDCEHVFIERDGRILPVHGLRLDEKSLVTAGALIARACNDEFSRYSPLLDASLPDGSRVAGALPPCTMSSIVLTIRKFGRRHYSLEQLVDLGTLPAAMLAALQTAIRQRENILISGATSVGKTTLLNAIAQALPREDRIIVIEETPEIHLEHPNTVRLVAHQPDFTIRRLVRAALRHRPDRLLLGEVRGPEAADLLQVLNTGHSGSMSTIHASSGRLAIQRLVSCVLQAGEQLPYEAICAQIADTIQLVLHLERQDGQRRAQELVRLRRYDFDRRTWEFETVCSGAVMETPA